MEIEQVATRTTTMSSRRRADDRAALEASIREAIERAQALAQARPGLSRTCVRALALLWAALDEVESGVE